MRAEVALVLETQKRAEQPRAEIIADGLGSNFCNKNGANPARVCSILPHIKT